MPHAALIFYGAALLLAAARGNADCEVPAFSNHLLRAPSASPPGLSRIGVTDRRTATR